MLPNIKVCQSDSKSVFCSSKLSFVLYTVCLQKDHFGFWLAAAIFVYIHTKCSGLTG